VDQSEAPGQPILLRKRGDALMRAYSTGTDLIGSLRPGVVVAAAEDDYVVSDAVNVARDWLNAQPA